jgi:hypothetical protein
MLPLENPEAFVRRLVEFKPDVLVVQDFHDSGGAFGADTGAGARKLLAETSWNSEDYSECVALLRRHVDVFDGEAGFFPPMDSTIAVSR